MESHSEHSSYPDEKGVSHLKSPCSWRHIHIPTNQHGVQNNWHYMIQKVVSVLTFVRNDISAYLYHTSRVLQMRLNDILNDLEELIPAAIALITFITFLGKNHKHFKVDVLLERRYFSCLYYLMNSLNTVATVVVFASYGDSLLSIVLKETYIPNYVLQTVWICDLSLAIIITVYVKYFTPPLTDGESGVAKSFPMLYGSLVSTEVLCIAAFRSTSERWKKVDFAFAFLTSVTWVYFSLTLRDAVIRTGKALVNVAKQDYGAFDLEFFEILVGNYKGPATECPIKIEDGNLKTKEYGRYEVVHKKEPTEFARSPWSLFWESHKTAILESTAVKILLVLGTGIKWVFLVPIKLVWAPFYVMWIILSGIYKIFMRQLPKYSKKFLSCFPGLSSSSEAPSTEQSENGELPSDLV